EYFGQGYDLVTSKQAQQAFDVSRESKEMRDAYVRNGFGQRCLLARRLVEAGVRFVQVNLGKNSSWDTHRRNFVNLKDNLLPPMDLAVSALLEDLSASGLLDETLVIVSGEFGRTPKINKDAGRDHWGPCNTMLFAGGGVPGGRIVGSTDRLGASVTSEKVLPQNFAATVYNALGIPRDAHWIDLDSRPHHVYAGDPIRKIYG
ncbi:MAG: DUF1501 domain-containing protein, partial [Pirellulaceae bacterium]|nr:DUF1501 domain-containing protein [Pirellulaceae bacterium]